MSLEYKLVSDKQLGPLAEAEQRDCAVVALSFACEVPYVEAYEFLAKNGRKPNHGTEWFLIMYNRSVDGIPVLGHTVGYKRSPYLENRLYFGRVWKKKRPTISQLLPQYKTGKHVFSFDSHVAAVVDGKIVDRRKIRGNTQVLSVWTFTKEEENDCQGIYTNQA